MIQNKKIQGWESLHEKQQHLYKFLAKNKGDTSLTLEDMREELGVDSLNTAVHHIRQLERKGYIRKKGGYGDIELLPAPVDDIVYLNLYGTVGCSPTGFFNEDNIHDRIPFPVRQLRVNPNSFLVEARGDSMEPMIHDHDLILVDRGPVSNGAIAVIVDQTGAKIKQVYRVGKNVVLQSLNPKVKPTVVAREDVSEVGVVRGVVRSFSDQTLKNKKSRS